MPQLGQEVVNYHFALLIKRWISLGWFSRQQQYRASRIQSKTQISLCQLYLTTIFKSYRYFQVPCEQHCYCIQYVKGREDSKVNYSLMRMNCPFPSHIFPILFSFLSSSDTGNNQCLCFLSMRVPQAIEIYVFSPLGSWADMGIMSVFIPISSSNISTNCVYTVNSS